MTEPTEVTIPILMFESESTLRYGKKEKVFESPEIPFALKRIDRNPEIILKRKAALANQDKPLSVSMSRRDDALTLEKEKKVGMAQRGIHDEYLKIERDSKIKSLTNVLQDLPDLKKNTMNKELYENRKWCRTNEQLTREIEAEIDIKLSYLDIIQELKESLKFEREGNKNEKIKAMEKVKLLEEEKANLLIDTKTCLVKAGDIDNLVDNNLIIPQGPCMKFSNLFDLSGQFSDFCSGEYGSKFVIDRLKGGASPERDYAMKELNLPQNLLSLLDNPHSAKIVTVLATIEHKGRDSILFHIETLLPDIASSAIGSQLIKDVLNCANEKEENVLLYLIEEGYSNYKAFQQLRRS